MEGCWVFSKCCVHIQCFIATQVLSLNPPVLLWFVIALCQGCLDFMDCFPPPAFPVHKQQECSASCIPKIQCCQSEDEASLLQVLSLHQNLTVHRIFRDTLLWGGLEINIPNSPAWWWVKPRGLVGSQVRDALWRLLRPSADLGAWEWECRSGNTGLGVWERE